MWAGLKCCKGLIKEPFCNSILAPSAFSGVRLRQMSGWDDMMVQPEGTKKKRCRCDKNALIVITKGTEDMEAVITADMLRRVGVCVTIAGLDGPEPVVCDQNVKVLPDASLSDALAKIPLYDAVILPGGFKGAERFCESGEIRDMLRSHERAGKIVAAICAAPTVLVAHGVAKGKQVTSYPVVRQQITSDYQFVEGKRVVVDGNIITSRGPGTAYWFGLALIEQLTSKEKADMVEKGMLIVGF